MQSGTSTSMPSLVVHATNWRSKETEKTTEKKKLQDTTKEPSHGGERFRRANSQEVARRSKEKEEEETEMIGRTNSLEVARKEKEKETEKGKKEEWTRMQKVSGKSVARMQKVGKVVATALSSAMSSAGLVSETKLPSAH